MVTAETLGTQRRPREIQSQDTTTNQLAGQLDIVRQVHSGLPFNKKLIFLAQFLYWPGGHAGNQIALRSQLVCNYRAYPDYTPGRQSPSRRHSDFRSDVSE